MSEDRGFEVIDRRGRAAAEPEPAAGATGEHAAPESQQGVPEKETAPAGGMPMEFSVAGILAFAHSLLAERAWVTLGLVPDPLSGQVQRDLEEARRAIDALGDLYRHLEAHATPEERRELQGNLANLRINYARQAGSG